MSAIEKTKNFFGEVKSETKKITWPKFDELKESTKVVIVTVLILTIFISVVDLLVNKAVNFIMMLG